MSKVKKLKVHVIDRKEHPGIYQMLESTSKKYHKHLAEAKIALAETVAWKADKDGRCILGKCIKSTDLQREFHEYDFVIVINTNLFGELSEDQKLAVLDHELCHAEVSRDDGDNVIRDEKNRPVYRTRKHDLEEFREIVERHGLYKDDVTAFAKTCLPLFKEQEVKTV